MHLWTVWLCMYLCMYKYDVFAIFKIHEWFLFCVLHCENKRNVCSRGFLSFTKTVLCAFGNADMVRKMENWGIHVPIELKCSKQACPSFFPKVWLIGVTAMVNECDWRSCRQIDSHWLLRRGGTTEALVANEQQTSFINSVGVIVGSVGLEVS